jgi:hypothetical protein
LAGGLTVQGNVKDPLTVRLQSWGAITGRVVDAAGKPMGDVEIYGGQLPEYLLVKAPDGEAYRVNESFWTDQDGHFRIEGLAPGVKYTLQARKKWTTDFFGKLVSNVTVESGETKDLGDLTAKKVSSAVDKKHGKPIAEQKIGRNDFAAERGKEK